MSYHTQECKFHSSLNIYVIIYFQDVSDDEIIADGELSSASSTDPCSLTDLVPVTSQFVYMLQLLNSNAFPIIGSKISWFTFPDFDTVTKKLLEGTWDILINIKDKAQVEALMNIPKSWQAG